MARAKLYETLIDAEGDIIVGATVTVRQPGTSTPIVETIYAADTGGTTLTNPLTSTADGSITFYLDAGRRVDLFVVASGYANKTLSNVPVLDDPADIETHTHSNFTAAATDPPTANGLVTAQSLVKAWASLNDSGGTYTFNSDYNVSGLIDNATGDVTITLDRDTTGGGNYAGWAIATEGNPRIAVLGSKAAGSYRVEITDEAGVANDEDFDTGIVGILT
jgi:hypothetical protein